MLTRPAWTKERGLGASVSQLRVVDALNTHTHTHTHTQTHTHTNTHTNTNTHILITLL